MPRILGLMLLLPALELLAFAIVVALIGFGKAVLLQVAISLIGVAMLGSLVNEAKASARRGGGVMSFALDARHGMRGLAGLMFAIPGFITDALGVVALVPEFRNRLRRFILGPQPEAARVKTPPSERPARLDMVDLDEREWREVEPATRSKKG